MTYLMRMICVFMLSMIAFGCATGPQMVYVSEAQEVTAKALEPVSIDDKSLRDNITNKWAKKISSDKTDAILEMVREQITKTKRFSVMKEYESLSVAGKNYIIEPHIEDIIGPEIINIPTDPTRKKIKFTARVRLNVIYYDTNATRKTSKSFSDTRVNEIRESVKNVHLDMSRQQELIYETIEVAFKAAANKLGQAFNPSYISGKVTKVNGKRAYISIDFSKLEKMPVMKRIVEVLDDNDQNKVIAVIESLKTDGGEPNGFISERGGTVKEGARVRALVNDLQQ